MNSRFTARVFRETFLSLGAVHIDVLYPSLNTVNFDRPSGETQALAGLLPEGTACLFLSLNRYERKKDRVTFLRSPSDDLKVALLRGSAAVLYTPSREHFGIVPVEAMYCCCPVVAVSSGGPLESVEDGETGFLCEPTAGAFSQAMERRVREPQLRRDMGPAGRKRVQDKFSLEAFSNQLHGYILRLSQ